METVSMTFGKLVKLVEVVDEKTDVVNGYKLKREDTVARRCIGWIYNKLLRLMYHPPVSDVDCDFRLIKNQH